MVEFAFCVRRVISSDVTVKIGEGTSRYTYSYIYTLFVARTSIRMLGDARHARYLCLRTLPTLPTIPYTLIIRNNGKSSVRGSK